MKKIIVVGIMMWLVLALSVSSFAFQNEPDGFRGLKWGDPLPTEEFEYIGEMQLAQVYIRPTDELFIQGIPLIYIAYSFYNDKFIKVDLFYEGTSYVFLELVDICTERFGEPIDRKITEVYWFFYAGVGVFLQYNNGEGSLSVFDTFEKTEMNAKWEESKKIKGGW